MANRSSVPSVKKVWETFIYTIKWPDIIVLSVCNSGNRADCQHATIKHEFVPDANAQMFSQTIVLLSMGCFTTELCGKIEPLTFYKESEPTVNTLLHSVSPLGVVSNNFFLLLGAVCEVVPFTPILVKG